jgi:catechol 2,3-dioxygenase-like lactoylglutathione lyase family enzyme
MAEISGIAHIQLCVSDMNKSLPFYSRLLGAMGMIPVMDDKSFYYCVGGKTGVAITPAAEPYKNSKFTQGAIGLHHVCFRAKSRDDVESLYKVACELGATIIRKPEESNYAPGYYSTLFEDPDGIRIEVNYVPGKGLLNERVPPSHP